MVVASLRPKTRRCGSYGSAADMFINVKNAKVTCILKFETGKRGSFHGKYTDWPLISASAQTRKVARLCRSWKGWDDTKLVDGLQSGHTISDTIAGYVAIWISTADRCWLGVAWLQDRQMSRLSLRRREWLGWNPSVGSKEKVKNRTNLMS